MASIQQNYYQWTNREWSDNGDRWSNEWGGTSFLWHGTILPRIHRFLPATHILEIAPGYGRCTQYLINQCERFSGIDLAPNCVEGCKKRFIKYSHSNFFVTNGLSLDMVADDSIDFVFSWDSLVHAEEDVLKSYITQLQRKLHVGGKGFLHHSNMGVHIDPITKILKQEQTDAVHWRAHSMTAEIFRDACFANNMQCVSQEIINWLGSEKSDCFSLFENVPPYKPPIVVLNSTFLFETNNIKRLSQLYC